MHKSGFISLIIKVVLSWQVILTVVILVIYFKIVFYVARLDHSLRKVPAAKVKKKKAVPKKETKEEVNTEEPGLEE
jgi:hypothetical protein